MDTAVKKLSPAGDLGIIAPVGTHVGAPLPVRRPRLYTDQRSDAPLRDDLLRQNSSGERPVCLAIIQKNTRFFAGRDHRIALFQSPGQRFLTQDLLSRFCRRDHGIRVEMVRRTDFDRIDFGIRQNLLKPGHNTRIANQRCPRRRFLPVKITANNDSRPVRMLFVGIDVILANNTAAD